MPENNLENPNYPSPAGYYLFNSTRANAKLIYYYFLTFIPMGIVLGIATTIPLLTDPLPEHLLNKLILDVPVWLMALPLPLILLFRSKPHKEWQETHKNEMECPRKSLTAKEFTTATYLEIFLFTIISFVPLIINWSAAITEGSSIREKLFTIGVFNLGTVFFHIWMMTALVFIFRFTKARRAILMLLCFFASLLATMGLQSLLTSLEIPYAIAAAICALLGLIVLRIGWAITVRLYEKVDF
ncbi:MAG: hypothetical protein FWC76_01340 [Defluviitaleaceae bacterium]|nr:hypothetical protein [Defluviitaleaceae bacterium]